MGQAEKCLCPQQRAEEFYAYRHSDTASEAAANASHYSAEESANQILKSLFGAKDRPAIPRHDADLKSTLLLGCAPHQAPAQAAHVARITDRALDHQSEELEIFRAHLLRNFDLADNAGGSTHQEILRRPPRCNGLRSCRTGCDT